MTVHIDEMTTSVEAVAAAAPMPASDGASENTPGQRERARRAAERAARTVSRTRSEGYDD